MKLTAKKFSVKDFLVKYALFLLIFALWIFYGTNSPHFFSLKNLYSLLTNAAPLLIYACGMTYILILGEIDLSVGSVGGVAAAVWMLCLTKLQLPLLVAFGIAIAVGLLCGLLTGLMVVKLRINAFMTSLGMQFALRGICYLSVGGEQMVTPAVVHEFANWRLFNLSPLVYLSLAIAVIMSLLYRCTAYGRKVQAVGCNPTAAKTVGINVGRTKLIAFIISGGLAALAGTLQCTNFGICFPAPSVRAASSWPLPHVSWAVPPWQAAWAASFPARSWASSSTTVSKTVWVCWAPTSICTPSFAVS